MVIILMKIHKDAYNVMKHVKIVMEVEVAHALVAKPIIIYFNLIVINAMKIA